MHTCSTPVIEYAWPVTSPDAVLVLWAVGTRTCAEEAKWMACHINVTIMQHFLLKCFIIYVIPVNYIIKQYQMNKSWTVMCNSSVILDFFFYFTVYFWFANENSSKLAPRNQPFHISEQTRHSRVSFLKESLYLNESFEWLIQWLITDSGCIQNLTLLY